MPPVVEDTKPKKQRYCCSNPNCNRVFSRPKVIKYYVCPTCQTLVNMNEAEDEREIQVALAAQKLVKRRKSKIIAADKTQGLGAIGIETEGSQPTQEEPCAPEEKREESEKLIALEQVQVPQQNTVALASTQQVGAVETKTVSPSSSGCQYGFGYLSQRGKGEGIPDTCIECPKSLNCMLSEYYKKEESVKEIKKWYGL